MTTYECRICQSINSSHRQSCQNCGTIRAEASPLFRAINGRIRQVESSIHDSGYIETALNAGLELSLMRVNPTRVMMRNLRTVNLTYYAQE